MLSEAQRFWDAIVGKVRQVAQEVAQNAFRCERYEVTTAPNGSKMGVTLPLGKKEIFLPYSAEVSDATVGSQVLVVWWGSMSTAKVYYYADGYRGPTVTQIGAVSTSDVQYKLYNSVTDIGLTSGSATIAGAWSAMPEQSVLIAGAGEFASSARPSASAWGQIEIVKNSATNGYIEHHGLNDTIGDYRMFLNSSYVPSGTWVRDDQYVSSDTPTATSGTIISGAFVKRSGNTVILDYGATGVSVPTTNTKIGTIPAKYAPPETVSGQALIGFGSGQCYADVTSGGDIRIRGATAQSGQAVRMLLMWFI